MVRNRFLRRIFRFVAKLAMTLVIKRLNLSNVQLHLVLSEFRLLSALYKRLLESNVNDLGFLLCQYCCCQAIKLMNKMSILYLSTYV